MDDVTLAKKYVGKSGNAKQRDIEFTLTFSEFKALFRRKTCYYTGIPMRDTESYQQPKPDTRTIDRIDSSLGYVAGNVVPCCYAVNQLKSVWESPTNPLTLGHIKLMMKKL